MKGAFSLFPSGLYVVLEVEGQCAPSVSVYSRTVRQLLSGSLTHTRTKSLFMRLHPDVTASVSLFPQIFRNLLPTQDDVKPYSCVLSPLCRFT